MRDNFEDCLRLTLQHEGGFADHPDDPGGATMKGVTLRTFRDHFGPATVADLKAITWGQLVVVYRGYWTAVRAEELPAGVDYAAFDAAVNSGPRRSILWLQGAAGVTADGIIGPITLRAVGHRRPDHLVNGMTRRRLEFLEGLDNFDVFGRGWTRRVKSVRADALSMVEADQTTEQRKEPRPPEPKRRPGLMERWQHRIDGVARRLARKFGSYR
jgi:lysozyme family protein